VTGETAILQDPDGDTLDGFPELAEALAAATSASELIVDGYVTAEVVHGGVGTMTGEEKLDSPGKLVTQTLFGQRRKSDDRRLDEGRAARMPHEDDPVALVLVDLLWLDGTPLLDIPLLERRRLLDAVVTETDLVRRGTFVRPPIDTWVGSWRSMGFPGLSFKAANSRYVPGSAALDWASIAMPRR
jgi:ATP-dependent DNA ligase